MTTHMHDVSNRLQIYIARNGNLILNIITKYMENIMNIRLTNFVPAYILVRIGL
jgi:hypothetical protein